MKIKSVLLFFLILVAMKMTAQTATPEHYSKINFSYLEKSNYTVEAAGVFADTVLLAFDFPHLKYSRPLDARDKNIGFIALKDFSGKDKERLSSALYHTNQTVNATYDKKTNKTKFTITRDDANTKAIFKTILKERYSKFVYTVTIDYNKKTIVYDFPNVDYKSSFAEKQHRVVFFKDSKTEAYYKHKISEALTYKNLIFFDENISDKIVPYEIFYNVNYGVEKIISVNQTKEIISVAYE